MKKFILFVTIVLTNILSAQVPQGFSYQAVAFNSTGSPVVSSTVSVRISILDNSATGTNLYTETHSKTTNANGLYSLTIGQGTPTSGTFNSINWAVNSKFLKVELDPTGGTSYTIVGTSQFLSVPYALIADSVLKAPINNSFGFFVKEVCTCANPSILIDTIINNGNTSNVGSKTEYFYTLYSGMPEDVIVKVSGLPSGLSACTYPDNFLANNTDTIFYGLYNGGTRNSSSAGNYNPNAVYYFQLDSNSSLSGSYTAKFDFLNKGTILKSFTKQIYIANCGFKSFANKTGSKSILSNTCGLSLSNTINVSKGSNNFAFSNILNSTATCFVVPDCNGLFNLQYQGGNISYNGKNYTLNNGSFNSTGRLTLNFDVWDTATSTSSTCTIIYQ